ncbi:MAG: LamG-like jellyroll fold domain-containing protein [Candidatus Omnitrophota bacterium]
MFKWLNKTWKAISNVSSGIIAARSLTVFAGTAVFIVFVSAATANAAVIFDDRFTQASDTTLDSHTPTNAGASWSVLIQNGAATMRATAATDDCQVNTGGDDDGVLYQANVTGGYQTADYEASVVSVDGNSGDDWNWIAVRVQDANNMYVFRFNESSGQLFKRTAGTYTALGAATAGIVDGSVVVLRVIGDTLTVLDDGATIRTLTDTDHTTAGTAGLGMGNIDETATDNMNAQILDTFSVTTYARVTGTVYTDEGVTTMGSGRTVSVSINGAAAAGSANTDAGGVYDIGGLTVVAGDVLTVYLDGAAEDGVTVTVADGDDLNIDLYQDYLKLRQDNGGSLTNANLDTADNNGDTDITALFSVSGGALTVSSGIELLIDSGHTFVPGGDVTADTFDINGVFTAAGNTVTISGDWDATGGSFSFTTGAVIFNGGATTQNVISNGSAFNHVQLGTGSAGSVVAVTDNMDINGNVTVLNGGATTWDVTNRTINAAGSIALTNLDTFTNTGSTFVFDGTTTLTSAGYAFNNIQLGTGSTGGSLTTADNMDINGTVTALNGGATTWNVDSDTINVASTVTLTNLDTFTTTGSTFIFDGTTSLTSAGLAFNAIQIGTGAIGASLTAADNMDINGNVTVLNGGATTWDVTNRTINAAGSITLTNLDTFTTTGSTFIFDGTTTLTSAGYAFNNIQLGTGSTGGSLTTADNMDINGTVTVLNGGATTWNVDSDTINVASTVTLTNLDTFTTTGSTFVFDGTTTLTSNSLAFNNVDLGTGLVGGSLTTADNMEVNGNMTILNGGATTWDVTGDTITIATDLDLTNLDTFTVTTSTFVFDGTTSLTSAGKAFNNIQIGTGAIGASLTAADNMDINGNVTVLNGGATTWDVTSRTINAAGSITLTNLDAFTTTGSTFVFDGTTTLTSNNLPFNNVELGTGSGGGSLTTADNMEVNGNMTILNGGATTWDVSGDTITIATDLDLTNLDTFTVTTSTFVFDGTTSLTSAGKAFNNIQIGTGGVGASLTPADNMDINGNVTVLNGGATTWDVTSRTINAAGSITLTNLDTFTNTGSTFIFDGATTLTSAGYAFNNIQLGTGSTGGSLTTADNMDINGTVTVLNGGATTWNVDSDIINVASTVTLTNLDTFTTTGSTFIFDGTTSLTSAGLAFNAIQIGTGAIGASLTAADNMDINGAVTVLNGGATTWDVTNRTINAAGNVDLTNLDTFTVTGSTFVFDGTTSLTTAGYAFNNIQLGSATAGGSLTPADNMDINGTVTALNGGATTWNITSRTINAASTVNLTNLDTFTVTGSTFVFDGTTTLTSNNLPFNNVELGTGSGGGSLTTASNMEVNGNMTILNGGATVWNVSDDTITIATNLDLTNLDTFTVTNSTFAFDGTTSLTSAGYAFNNIQLGSATAGGVLTPADNMDINGNVTVLNGGATTWDVSNRTINAAGSITLTNLDTFTTTGSTFIFDGTTTLTSAGLAFNAIQIGTGAVGASVTAADNMDINGALTVLNGGATTFNVTSRTINVASTVTLTNLDTFTTTGSTFVFDGTTSLTSAGLAFNNIQLGSATAGGALTPADNMDINGTVAVLNGGATTWDVTGRTINAANTVNLTNLDTFTVTGSTFIFDGGATARTVTSAGFAFNNFQIGSATAGASVTMGDTADINGTITVTNAAATTWNITSRTINAASTVNLTNLDTFTVTGSTFVFDGTTTLTSAGRAFNNIQLGSATAGGSLTPADTMDINGTVTVQNGGATTWDVTSRTVNAAGSVNLTNLDTFTVTGSTFIFDGTTALTSAGYAFNNIQLGSATAGGSLTPADNMDINGTVTVLNGGATTWNVTSRTINVASTVTLTNLDTFTTTGSTFIFDGTTSLTSAGLAFNAIQIGTGAIGASLTAADNMDINGNVTVLNGGATTWNVTSRTVNTAGNVDLTNLDTFTVTGSTFVFDGTTSLTTAGYAFNNIQLGSATAGGSLTPADNMDINGTVTALNGGATTWNITSRTINAASTVNLTNLDTFTVTGSTFVFDGTTTLTSNNLPFNNVELGTGSGGGSLTTASNMEVNGNMTILNGGATTWDVAGDTITIATNLDLTNLDTFTVTTSTFVFDGTTSLTSAGKAFNNIQIGTGAIGASLTAADNMDINGAVTVLNGGATTWDVTSRTINAAGSITLTNLDTFTTTGSTFIFDGTTTLTSAGYAFNNIQLGTGSSGGSLTTADNMDINGTVTVLNGGATTWNVDSDTINVASTVTLTNLDTFTTTGSTFIFDGTTSLTSAGLAFNAIQIGTGGIGASLTAADNMDINGNVTVLNGGATTWDVTGRTINAAGSVNLTNLDTFTVTGSTFVFDGTIIQTVTSTVGGYFERVQISNTTNPVNLGSDLDLIGTLTIDPTATLDVTISNYDINLFGGPQDWINNGSFIPQSATVTFNPSAAGDIRIFGLTTFYNLNFDSILSGNVVISDNLTVQNNLMMNLTDPGSGVDSDAAETHTIFVAGNVINTNAADMEADLTIEMNGTAVQTISQTGSGVFGDITISNIVNEVLMLSSLTVADDITVNANTVFDLDDNDMTGAGATTFTINGTLELDGGQAFVSADPVFSAGAWAEYTATGGTQSIQDWSYSNIQINGAGGTFTMQTDETISGQFMNLNGMFDTTASNYNLTTTGSFRLFGGNFTANASTVTLNNNLYIANSSGLFTGGTSTVVLNASFDVFNPDGANSLSNVLQRDGVTTTLVGNFSIGNAGVFTTGDATSTIQTDGNARDLQFFGTSSISNNGVVFNTAAPTGDLRVVYFGGSRTTGGGNYNITPFLISLDDAATLILGSSLTVGQFTFQGVNAGDSHTFDSNGQTFNASLLTIGTTGFIDRYSTFNGGSSIINITNDLTILSSDGSGDNSLNGQTATITIGDDWSNSGVFTPGTSTVEFLGNSISLAGSTTFYNLIIEETSNDFADPIVTLTAGETYVIEGTLRLNGLDANDRVTMRSSVPGVRWNISITSGTGNVDYLDVSDSEVVGTNDILGTNSLNTDNNDAGEGSPQWVFVFGGVIDITGTSNLPGGTMIRVAATGSFQNLPTTLTNGDGSWTISNVPGIAIDEILHIWAEGVAEALESNAVTLYDGAGNVTGMILETNVLVIGSDDNATVTLLDMNEFDNDDDEDMMFTANGGVLNVDAGNVYSDERIRILAGNTLVFGPGEILNARDVTIEGTLDTAGVTTINITNGDWANSGTFVQANSTVTFNILSGNNTTFSGTTTFYNVSYFGDGTTTVMSGALVSDNNLLLTAGTLDINDNTLTVNGTLSISGGQLFTGAGVATFGDAGADVVTITSGTLRIESDDPDGGDIIINAATWNNTGGTIEFTGSSSATIFSTLEPYNNLVLNNATSTYTANNNIDVNGYFRLIAGTFSQNVSNMNVAGNFTLESGTTFTKAGVTGTLILDGDLYFADHNVVKQDLGRLFIGSSPDTTTLTTDMAATTLTVDTGDALVTDGYEVDISGAVIIDGLLDARSGTDNTTTIYTGGPWDMSAGVFSGSRSTVVFDGASGTTTFTVGSNSFYNLTIDDSNGGGDYTVSPTSDFEITGTLTVADGTFDADGYEATVLGSVDINDTLDLSPGTDGNATMYVGSSWDASGGTFTNTASTVVFTGVSTLSNITSDSKAFNNVIFDDGVVGYWKMDEYIPPTMDSSRFGNNGTWNDVPVFSTNTSPSIGFNNSGALAFDGSNDYVSAPIGNMTVPLTMCAWYNIDPTSDVFNNTAQSDTIVMLRSSAANYESFIIQIANTAAATASVRAGALDNTNGSYSSATGTTNLWSAGGTWHHVCGVFENSTSRSVYLDGVREGTNTGSEDVQVSTLFVGVATDSTTFTSYAEGIIDDVRVYNRVLNDAEIANLAGGGYSATTGHTLTDTLDVNGTLSFYSGTLNTGSNNNITIEDGWLNYAGAFIPNMAAVIFDGTGAGRSILSAEQTFYDVNIPGSGSWILEDNISTSTRIDINTGTITYTTNTALEPVTLFGDMAITGGTFTGTSTRFRHDGNLTIQGGTYTAPTDVLEISGTFTHSGGTFTNSGSTVMFIGTLDSSQIDTAAGTMFNDLIINDGLVGYWKLDELSSPSVDSSGYGNAGIWSGNTATAVGPQAINFTNPRSKDFDGTGDYITVPTIYLPGEFTFSTWVNTDDITNPGMIIGEDSGTSGGGPKIGYSTGAFFVRIVSSSDTAVAAPAVGTWNHIAITRNSSNVVRLYVNGTSSLLFGGAAQSGVFGFNRIGANGADGSQELNGRLDDFRVYDRALNAAEILALADGNMPGTSVGTYTLQDTLIINGTLMLNAGELNVGSNQEIDIQGSWMNHGGVFTANNGNVYFDGGPGPDYILSGSQTFNVVDITGSPTLTLLDNIPVSGALTNTSGTLTYSTDTNIEPVSVIGDYINLAGTFTGQNVRFRHQGNLTIQGGTYTAPTDVLEISGTFTHSGGTFTNSNSTVMFIGTMDSQINTAAGTVFDNLIINDGLVGYWKFDESASPAYDYSGYNAHGTWNGNSSSTSVPGTIQFTDPRSASFIGGSYIRVTNHDAIDIGGTNMTIAAWINVVDNGSGGSDQIFAGKAYYDVGTFASPYFQYDLEFDDNGANTFDFYFTSTAGAFQGPFSVTPTLGQWNHVAFTYDGANVRGYLNGVNTSTTPETDQIIQRGRDLLFGVDGGLSQPFNGSMDELRIYNRALSTAEIQALASGTTPQAGLGTNTLQTDLNIDGTLFINSGELDAGSNRLINIAGSWFNHGGIFDEQTSTVIFNAQSGTVDILDMHTFYNLVFDDTPGAGATFRQNSPLGVSGTLSINGGTLDASTDNHSINLAGNWVNNDTFNARSGTVTLVGTAQLLRGATSFYHLAKTETSNDATDSVLTFEAGTIFTIGGALRLQGFDDDDRINLVSSIPGTRFTFDVTGGNQRVRFIDVTDSQSSSNNIVARRTVEGANTDTNESAPQWVISIGDIFEWTGVADNITWSNQLNWDFGDNTPGNDGYPDDEFEEVYIYSGSDNIVSPSGTLTIGGMLMTSGFSGSLTLSGTLVVDDSVGLDADVIIRGGTLFHVDNSTAETNKLIMQIDGDLLLDAGTQINVDGLGYDSGFGPGAPTTRNGGSYGGIGGDHEEDGTDGAVYGSITAPVNLGSGGGAGIGGDGGGAVILTVSGTTTIDGTISAEGGSTGADSGSGGSIFITTGRLMGTGTMSVNGGEGVSNRGGGGGGRLALVLTESGENFSAFTGTTTAYGGNGWVNFNAGAAGTIYLETEPVLSGQGTLIIDNDIDNKTLDVTRQVVTQMPAGVNLNNFSEIIIRNGGYLGIDADDTINFGTVNLTTESTAQAFITIIDDSGVTFPDPYVIADYTLNADGVSSATGDWMITTGALSHSQNGETEEFKINMTLTGNLNISSTGRIDVSEKGFESGKGPGAPGEVGGGAYGGAGGDFQNDGQTSTTYGSVTAPTDLGSGGGDGGGGRAGAGGGAVILSVTGVTTVDGTIEAVGRDGGASGSGTGGSIYLTTGSLAGSGRIMADGGTGTNSRGDGGGGRIAVILTGGGADFSVFDAGGAMTAYGGTDSIFNNDGAAGTIYRQTASQGAGNGILIVDNNNNTDISVATNVYTALDDQDANLTVVGSLVIENGAAFVIGSDDELTVGGTLTTLTLDATGTLINEGTLNLGGSVFSLAGGADIDFSGAGNTVVYIGQDDDVAITPIDTVYYNLRFNNAGTSFTNSNDLDVNGSFNLDNGIFVQGNNDVNVAGNFTLASGTTFTKPASSGTLTFDGDLYFADFTLPQQDIGRLVIGQSPDTTILTTDMTATTLSILSTDVLVTDGYEITLTGLMDINGLLNAGSGTDGNTTIIVGGLWDMTGGAFTNTNSTVMFTGTSSSLTVTSDTKSFHNMIINDGLVGYWKADESADNDRVTDSSGYANHGTAANFAAGGGPSTTVSDTIKFANPRSLEFDGADDIVTIPDNDILDGLGPLTFAVWINPQTLGEGSNGRIIGKYNGTTQFRPDFRVNDNNSLLFRHDGSTTLERTTANNTITLNQWQHVAVTWDGGIAFSGVHIYVNGVEQTYSSSANGAGLNDGSAFNYYIGNVDTLDRTFDGHMDDIRIYNRVLSGAEILSLANGYMPGTGTGAYTLQDNLDVNGTLTINAGELHTGSNRDINVGRGWMNHGGIFTATNGDVFFDGSSSDALILSGSQTFYNVDVTGGGVWTLQDDVLVSSVFDVSAGTLTYSTNTVIEPINIIGDTTITGGTFTGQSTRFRHDGNLSITSGTYTAPTDVLEITESFTHTGGTFTNAGSIVMFTGTGTETIDTAGGTTFQDVIVNDGLLGYWKMDETSLGMCPDGSDTCDSSGYGYGGVWTGNVAANTAVPAVNFTNLRSVDFDGAGDYISFGDMNVIDGATTLSVALWVQVDNLTADNSLINKDVHGANAEFLLWRDEAGSVSGRTDIFSILISNGSTDARIEGATNSANDANWHHVAVTFQAGSVTGLRLYIDGVEDPNSPVSTAAIAALESNANPVRIGADSSGGVGLNGRMDDVRLYNRLLSTTEIQRLASGNMPETGVGSYTLQTNLDIDGTLTLNAGELHTGSNRDINVGRSWMNHGGIFTATNGDVFFDGSSNYGVILSGSQTFYNVDVTGSGVWTLQDDAPVSSVFDVSSGTLTYSTSTLIEPIRIVGNTAITGGTFAGQATRFRHEGDLSISAGTYTAPTDVVEIDGSFTHSAGTFTNSGSTVMFTGAGANTIDASGGTMFQDMIVNDGLVGYWKLDENASPAVDYSGYGNNGTWVGNAISSTNTSGLIHFTNPASIDLDGTNDYVEIADNDILDLAGVTNFTISAWIYPESFGESTQGRIIDKGGGTGPTFGGWVFHISNLGAGGHPTNGLVLQLEDSASNNTVGSNNNVVNINQWQHVAVTRNGSTVTFYVDGVNAGTGSASLIIAPSTDPIRIGIRASDTDRDFDGFIDEVRIYTHALSDNEILTMAQGNQPGTGVGTYTLQTNLDVDGTLRLNAGTLDVGANRQVNVGGDWENFGGIFVEQAGTVILDGTDQQIPSSETFYNLSKTLTVSPARTLTFGRQSTVTISNTLTLQGFNGSSRLNLRSSSVGTRFDVNVPSSVQTVNFVDVQDSEASGNNIRTNNSIDSGNTDSNETSPRWIFGPLRGAVMIVD